MNTNKLFHLRLLVITVLVLLNGLLFAQDFHLSQYDANPVYLNPALTGIQIGEEWNYRLSLNYRAQGWASLGGTYTDVSSTFDKAVNSRFAIGEYVVDDRSPNGAVNTLNGMLSGSYRIIHSAPDGHDKHNLSVGLQVGMLNSSLNPNGQTYDAQYSSSSLSGFDQTLPTGENFRQQSSIRFDANLGIYYRYYEESKAYSPFGGLTVNHLTQPNESFASDSYKTPMRWVLHGGCYLKVGTDFNLLPQFLYMNQANASEINLELLGFYKIPKSDYEPMLGFAWRNRDALILHLGLKHGSNIYRVSFDNTISFLNQYNNGRGAIEFSVVFTGKKRTPVTAESQPAATPVEEKVK